MQKAGRTGHMAPRVRELRIQHDDIATVSTDSSPKYFFFSDYRSLGKLFSKLYLSNHIEIEKLV